MDLLTGVGIRLRLLAPLPPALLGRWFVSIARAQPFHADIASVPPINHEILIAVPVHYAIGTFLAGLFLWMAMQFGWSARSLGVALPFGLSTSVLPWLLMFPAMDYGFFGVNGPIGTRLFLTSVMTHAFFGLGLWIGVHIVY
jgi:hypothetical protein